MHFACQIQYPNFAQTYQVNQSPGVPDVTPVLCEHSQGRFVKRKLSSCLGRQQTADLVEVWFCEKGCKEGRARVTDGSPVARAVVSKDRRLSC